MLIIISIVSKFIILPLVPDVKIAFTEDEYQIGEYSLNMLVAVIKDVQIASPITLSIIPRTIDEAIASNEDQLPLNVPEDNPYSSNRASKGIF